MKYDKPNQATFWRPTDGPFKGTYCKTKEEAAAQAKEYGWKLKDIEKIRINDVKGALLHLLNS